MPRARSSAIGLLVFALVGAFGITKLGAIPALIASAGAWLVVSIGIYTAVMAWRGVTKKRPQKASPG